MKRYNAEPLINKKLSLGEAPFYDARTGVISFVDIVKGVLYLGSRDKLLTQKSEDCLEKIEFGQMIGAAVPSANCGEYLVAGTDGLYLASKSLKEKIFDTAQIFENNQRSNDAKCDPMGRLYLGSSVYVDEDEPAGNLFCYDRGQVRVVQKDTRIANGMAWSSDRKKFYFSDSLYHCVFEYDYDVNTGDISNRRVLRTIDNGVPDGMCIDTDDNLWLAVWGGRRIEHINSKTGELIGVVDVPAQNVTSCCFLEKSDKLLFITSAGDGLDGEYDGHIFTCNVDAEGPECDYFVL